MAPASPPCRPLLVGYYGEHNLGDDALLTVLLTQLPGPCTPTVTARDQEEVQRRFGVATVDRRRLQAVLAALSRCDALVFGGGSLLQDSTSFASLLYYAALIGAARLRHRPVLLWAQGLGPLRRRRSRLLVRALLRLASGCSWRDGQSAALARQLGWRPGALQLAGAFANGGMEAGVGSDPVWSLEAPGWHGRGGPLVLCFRPTRQLQGPAWRPWLQALEQLAPDREILWLPFHRHQDRGLLQHLLAEGLLGEALAARSRELAPQRPEDVLAVCAGSGLVLAMRLHGLILAAVSGAPVAALSYDPKVAAAARALGCPLAELDAPPPPAVLLSQWQACLDQPPAAQRLAELRDAAAVHRQLLAATFTPAS
ncbi:polysaccharide pyruvyl transferase CsaB [Cyanobium sp. CH-040]|uniref:polysaccharide pyruvyl transferase CsaB n=1 Tax=Cyanobium sp. CH-040 TaxID=2823708 RepID=UPI0020CD97A6|nr:polysaccharide pyruvyl transferase CsaB [Cyanobium sp. CH-040]MCP9928768.1 polysaccharide pyruvyl transferase CsaB [Cyanobium sp. CH-040]